MITVRVDTGGKCGRLVEDIYIYIYIYGFNHKVNHTYSYIYMHSRNAQKYTTHTHTHTHTHQTWPMKWSAVSSRQRFVSILLYGCTTWTLTKRLEKKLDGNYTRMLRAILNKSWRQHPTRRQLYGHLPPITKTIQVRRARHAGHCWRSKDELVSDVLLWTPTYSQAKAGRPARTYIQQLCEDTGCNPEDLRRRWMIGRSGERWSRISVLAARHDDDDIYIYIYIYIYVYIYIYI